MLVMDDPDRPYQFELTSWLRVQPLRTCAMCVSKGGLTIGCSGPAAEPERWAANLKSDRVDEDSVSRL